MSDACMSNEGIHIRRADWTADRSSICGVRERVFIHEQAVPEEEEWDEHDAESLHVLALSPDGEAIGTGRLTPLGSIGRMAVDAAWRGRGVGHALLDRLLTVARELGYERVWLNAQTHALDFYAAHGFRAEGQEFMEAGIPHKRMALGFGTDGGDRAAGREHNGGGHS